MFAWVGLGDAGGCAGSRPYLGSGLLGSPENRYNLPERGDLHGAQSAAVGEKRFCRKPQRDNR
jgi:hypothetical protein